MKYTYEITFSDSDYAVARTNDRSRASVIAKEWSMHPEAGDARAIVIYDSRIIETWYQGIIQ